MVHRCVINSTVMWLHILVVFLLVCVCCTVRTYYDARYECENCENITRLFNSTVKRWRCLSTALTLCTTF